MTGNNRWDNWDHQRTKQFRGALREVYRTYGELKMFVRDAIDRNLADIVGLRGLEEAAFELLEWAQAKGEIDRLYAAFCTENPRRSLEPRADEIPSLQETPGDRYVRDRNIETICRGVLNQSGGLLRIKAPHQMGKTELTKRLHEFTKTQGYTCIRIDFRTIEHGLLADLERFWRWFCQTIADRLDIDTDLDKYWRADLGCNASCERYIKRAILKPTPEALVLVMENVDRLFDDLRIAEEVFRLMRVFFDNAADSSEVWGKLRQVLTYSTEPTIKLNFANSNRSPFNVGKSVELQTLSAVQVAQLAEKFGLRLDEAAIGQLMQDFGGHPALMQRAFSRLAAVPNLDLATLYSEALHPTSEMHHHLKPLLGALQQGDRGDLQTSLQTAMRQLVQAREPIALKDDLAYALHRLGLVNWAGEHRRCVVLRCRLYRDWFGTVLGDAGTA